MLFDNDLYDRILDNLYEGLYLVDRERKITFWNKAAEKITGFKTREVVGTSCLDNILTHVDENGNNLCEGLCPLAMSINDGKNREAGVFLHHKDGHRVPVSVRITNLIDGDGKVIGGIELFSDISNIKAIELRMKELEEMALLDNLTKLANRAYIEREIDMLFAETKRSGVSFGVLFIDIDRFKRVNDTYGHDTGDRVLKFVSETLIKNSRPFDPVGRWGGEEFVIIVRNITRGGLEELGNRLRILVENSYIIVDNIRLGVTISLGATLVRDDDCMDTLFKRVDGLLYASKKAGRNRLTIG